MTMSSFDTVEKCARDFVESLCFTDLKFLRDHGVVKKGLEDIFVEMNIKREIRNYYGLWWNNPMTERWRTDAASHIIIDGIDMSIDHPDAVSERIFKLAVKIAKNDYFGSMSIGAIHHV